MSTNKVSVLLLIFNRSDNALKVLEQIKLYHPTTLYIAADGPRKHKKMKQKFVIMYAKQFVMQ